MQISVGCTNCSNRYDVDEKFVGRKVKCKRCGNVFTIPTITTIPAPEAESVDLPDPFVNLSRAPLPEPEIVPPTVRRPEGPAFGYSRQAVAVQRQRSGIGRAGRDTGSVGVDGTTPYVLFLYVAASAVAGIYATVKLYSNFDQHVAGTLVGHVWSWVVVWNILFFAIVGPLVWLGIWLTSRIFGFEMVDSAYLRACGVAGLPVVLFYVSQMLPSNPVLIGLMLLAILPLTFYMLMHAFDLDWAGSAVAFTLGGAFWVGGFILAFIILGAVVAGGLMGAALDGQSPLTANSGNSTPSAPPPPDRMPPRAPRDPDADTIARLRENLSRMAVQDMSLSIREEMTGTLEGMKALIESLRAKHENESAWQELARAFGELEQKVAALPSGNFGDAYYTDAPAGDDWSTGPQSSGQLAGEVSFKGFYFRPPLDMKLDLRSVESGPEGLVWVGQKNSSARLSLTTLPRKNPKQRRPVVADRSGLKRAADAQQLFAVATGAAAVTTGTINALRFTKIAPDPADQRSFQKSIVYVAALADQWLVITLTVPREEGQLAQAMDVSARSLRKGEAGEEKVDPFSAKFIAARLADDPDNAIPILRAQGEEAETALSPLLESEDFFVRKRAAQLLEKIATKRSLPALEAATKSMDREVAASARAALKRLDPENYDEVTDLLDRLESGSWIMHKEALQKLADLTPQDKHRAAVVSRLLAISKDQDRFFNAELIGKALASWGDAKLVPDLVPFLEHGGDRNKRQIAMTALGALKDKRGASAVVMWLYEEPQQTIAALTEMGPAAEDAVMPHLRNADPRVRTSAAQVLEHVGTRKCLSELDRAAHDMRARDASAREAAQLAITAVKARIAAAPDPQPK
jgi:predicted Zn finger-like uncharacterized protein